MFKLRDELEEGLTRKSIEKAFFNYCSPYIQNSREWDIVKTKSTYDSTEYTITNRRTKHQYLIVFEEHVPWYIGRKSMWIFRLKRGK